MNKISRKVPIKNILYMFSYIWDKAENIDFTYLNNNDDFDSSNILAKLFIENIKEIKKRGLYKEYKEKKEEIRGIKGKIDFKESINKMSLENAKAFCQYDELEENNLINRLIIPTVYIIIVSALIPEVSNNIYLIVVFEIFIRNFYDFFFLILTRKFLR